MLDLLRRFYAHTAGKIITILVGLLFIVGFSFLPYIMGGAGGVSPEDIATVGGKGISINALSNYYGKLANEYERLYGNKLTKKQLSRLDLTGAALSSLIADRVLESRKKVFGVYVSNRFIARYIAFIPAFQKNGKFSDKLFKAFMLDNHETPAGFEKKLRNQITRSYIKRIIGESFSVADNQFLNDYKIKNKSVSFKIAFFDSKKNADEFLKKSALYNKDFAGQAKQFGGTVKTIPLFSEIDLVKSSYFKKYSLNGSILRSVFSTGKGEVAGEIFPVKSGYAAVKVYKIYFPEYVSDAKHYSKDHVGGKALAKQKEIYGFQKEQDFLDAYVNYAESKSNVKINRNALSAFHPY
jgi:hypothetical protein